MNSAASPAAPASEREPIRRGARARERVLSAALQVLAAHGLTGFTMEAVARQGNASKATLYRHWPSAQALLIDAMDTTFQPFAPPQTGDLRRDLTELLTGLARLLQDSPYPRLMAAFIDAAEQDPTLAELHADLTHRRRVPMLAVLGRARDAGDLPPATDLELTVDLLTGPFFYRRFIAHRPIPADLPQRIVDQVLAAHPPPECPAWQGSLLPSSDSE
jgi:AcrR family transcriptional regulator